MDKEEKDFIEEDRKEDGKEEQEKLSKKKKEDLLEQATKRYEREVRADKHNREAAVNDQEFIEGDQWSDDEKRLRKNLKRPALVLDELNRPINQVVGEMRLNKAHIKVIPSDAEGSTQTAKARQAIIHGIEYESEADTIYDYAGEMLTGCGFGAWRIRTRYSDENPFEQIIYMERIKNPLLVYIDSSATSSNGKDAKYGFVLEKMNKDTFEEKYPDNKIPVIEEFSRAAGGNQELWFDTEGFWIADYYVIENEEETFHRMGDGEVLTDKELKKMLDEWEDAQKEILEQKKMLREQLIMKMQLQTQLAPPQPPGGPMLPGQETPQGAPPSGPENAMATPPVPVPGAAPLMPLPPEPTMPPIPPHLTIEKTRKKKIPHVKHYVIAPDEILEGPNDVPGKFIPIILVRGPEKNVDGKIHTRSLIRKAKDAQRLLNWTETSKGELIAMMPHAPWVGTAEQIQPYDDIYTSANIQNYAWIPYKAQLMTDDEGHSHLVPAPQRVSVGSIPVQLFQYSNDVKGYIEDAVGMGRQDTLASNDDPSRTGAAGRTRRRASDVGTFSYIDNLQRGIMHSGRVINEMIPEVYDTPRDVRIVVGDEDPALSFMPVNMPYKDAAERIGKQPERYQGINPAEIKQHAQQNPKDKYNDLNKGEYDVFIKVGPPFSTAREETAEQMLMLAVQGQKMNPVDKYFAVKNMNLADGGEYADVLRNMIPPHILPPKEGEVRPKQPIPPQMQLLLLKGETEKLKQQNLQLKTKAEIMKIAQMSKETDKEMRKIALQTLGQVFAPEAPPGPPGQGNNPMPMQGGMGI
jgi:hypothetical protein